jgi:hypothetical protein
MTFSDTPYVAHWLQQHQQRNVYGFVAYMGLSLVLAWGIYYFWKWWIYRLTYIAQINQIPGPPMDEAHFLMMHTHNFMQRMGEIPGHPKTPYFFPVLKTWCTAYAPQGIFRLWTFNPYWIPFARGEVYVLDPYLIRQFLTQYDKAPYVSKLEPVYRLAYPLIGGSFISLPSNAAWKHQRKRTAAAFHVHMLEYATQTITQLLHEKVFPQWDRQSKSNNNATDSTPCGVVDVVPWCSRLTLEALGQVAFSHSFGSLEDVVVDPDTNNNDCQPTTSLYTLYQFMLNELVTRMAAVNVWMLPFAPLLLNDNSL